MYLFAKGVDFSFFYGFGNVFWYCSYGVVLFVHVLLGLSSCSTSSTRRDNLVTNRVIGYVSCLTFNHICAVLVITGRESLWINWLMCSY